MSFTFAALVVAYAAIILLGLAVAGLLAQVRELQGSRSGVRRLSVGDAAPAINQDGSRVAAPFAALFASPTCDVCQLVIPEVVERFGSGAGSFRLIVVSDIPFSMSPYGDLYPDSIGFVVDPEARRRFSVAALPWMVIVGEGGTISVSRPIGKAADAVDVLTALSVQIS